MKIIGTFLVGVLILIANSATAQKGVEDGSKYGHGEDSILCVRSLSLYREFIGQKDYETAHPYWRVTFTQCPKASKNIYIDGAKIYSSLINGTDDPEVASSYLDTLMLVYDQRIEYFGDKGNVRGRQGVSLLRYGRNKIENIEKAYGYLRESIDSKKNKTSDPVLASYMSSSIILFQNEALGANKVIDDYLMISDIIDSKIAKKPSSKIKKLKATIDENFIEDGPGDCETLVEYFTPQVEEKKDDAVFLQMLTTLLRNRECTDSELFFVASKYLHPLAPTAGSALNIAILATKDDQFEEAINYYQQAIGLESEEDKKAEYYFSVAACYNGLENVDKARENARTAISIRPNWGEPYILIGQLYANSKNQCGNLKLPNAIYWAAVDKFVKAKNVDPAAAEKAGSLIVTYSKYFPNKEQAFFENIVEGDSYKVGCWINETTRVRFGQ